MRSSIRLDSALFQLTPTRTRCDLVVSANGRTEKIASGLLKPFLAHLKTAQDQMAKGGYSIILEPGPGVEAPWFTKSTVERFVRFVSTPEVLERVYAIESEISQIAEAIAFQNTNDLGVVEDRPGKPVESLEGSRPASDTNEEKAIVLYQPGAHPPEANGSIAQEGDSKVQLLRILETRKTVLEKEQGMAFARAVAAGFDIDHMAPLISFAECFGAIRLMDACKRFMELWKRKHETGQWLEIEAAQVSVNTSGYSELAEESNGKTTTETSSDKRPLMDHQLPQGQFPHLMYAPWPVQSPAGAVPVFQAYPVQGMPYYNSYPGNSPFFHPPYPSDDPRLNGGQRIRHKRHSVDASRDSNNETETWEMDGSQDEMELEEGSQNRDSRKKSGRTGKKKSGMVVIRNINYITSKKQNSSSGESESASGSETEEEGGPEVEIKNSMRSSKQKEDSGDWHAFQNFLLRDADEDKDSHDQGMFANEKEVQARRRQNILGDDPLSHGGHGMGEIQGGNMTDIQKFSGSATRIPKTSNDELISQQDRRSNDGRFTDGHMDIQMDGRRGGYRRSTNDDFMIHRSENPSSSDSLAVNRFEHANNNLGGTSQQNMDADSFIVPFRGVLSDQVGTDDRKVIDMDLEFPSTVQKAESNKVGVHVQYEPHDLSLMPERGTERGSSGYDPALDYEMLVHAEDISLLDKKNKEALADKQGPKKLVKERKKLTPDSSDKKKNVGPIRKGKPSKLSPLDEARARAEKLRTYKADLLKMKKEKEDEERKRLEGLKIERQRRIAARGGASIPPQSSLVSQQTKRQLPSKLSITSHNGSKLNGSEPVSSSPLQRSIKPASLGSGDSQKASRPGKLNNGSHSAGNKISQSMSSLPESQKQKISVTPDTKASMARMRRLSEPKMSSSHQLSSVKSASVEQITKPKSNGPESKKISAIMNLDKTKAATLPGLKIRTSKGPDAAQKTSSEKEVALTVNEWKSSVTPETAEPEMNGDEVSHNGGDDNPVIEKNVLTLECEKSCGPAAHASRENVDLEQEHYDNCRTGDKIEVVTDYAAIHVPASPTTIDGVKKLSTEHQKCAQPSSFEATAANAQTESLKYSNANAPEKLYQRPYARVSSMEDPCTVNSEYSKALPTSIEAVTTSTETAKISSDSQNLKLDKIPEALEKPHVKGSSSKGFKRLLKFGRKNHSSASSDQNADSDNGSVHGSETDDYATNAASGEDSVHTLKNLISQDDTPSANATPQKSSRAFSLLSPFRNKASEKKLAA